jgi:hypothetical protein
MAVASANDTQVVPAGLAALCSRSCSASGATRRLSSALTSALKAAAARWPASVSLTCIAPVAWHRRSPGQAAPLGPVHETDTGRLPVVSEHSELELRCGCGQLMGLAGS